MNWELNLLAFLHKLPLRRMSGQEKLLAMVGHAAKGNIGKTISLAEVSGAWRKSVLSSSYSATFYARAQEKGWLDPAGHGLCSLTAIGRAHLESLLGAGVPVDTKFQKTSGRLSIVERKGTFTAEKLLSQRFSSAKRELLVADSYVDRSTLEVVLNGTSDAVIVKVLYGNDAPEVVAAAVKWRNQFSKLEVRRQRHLHDRFFLVDSKGFVLGPSIKDAASNHPALLVELGGEESALLESFFRSLWKAGTS